MNLNYKKTFGTRLSSLFAISLLLTPTAQAASYKPCAAIAQELGAENRPLKSPLNVVLKVMLMANAVSKAYANVVGAHGEISLHWSAKLCTLEAISCTLAVQAGSIRA